MTVKEKEKLGLKPLNNRIVAVRKLDDKGNVIKNYPSVCIAADENNLTTSSILNAIKRNTRSGGFRWERIKKEVQTPAIIHRTVDKELGDITYVSPEAKKAFNRKPYYLAERKPEHKRNPDS